MSDNKMSPEMQIAIRRSPEYTAPSAELVALRAELADLRERVAKLEARPQYASQASTRGDTVIGPRQDYSIWHNRMNSRGSK